MSTRVLRNLLPLLLVACASTKPEAPATRPDPLRESAIPSGSELRFDLGNGALKFYSAPLEQPPENEDERRYAWGPVVQVRTDLGTRRQDFRKDLEAWDWAAVIYDEKDGYVWAFLEHTVAGPGDVVPVVASFDNGITWQRLKDIPKPHHAARFRSAKRVDAKTVEVQISLEADLAPERKNPKRVKEFVSVVRGKDLGRGGWSAKP